jgi:hypothetical protein
MIARRFVKPGNEVSASGTGGAGTYREPSGQLGLAGGCERGAFLMPNADPFDVASPHRVGERIKGIADQPEDVANAHLLENIDENFRD